MSKVKFVNGPREDQVEETHKVAGDLIIYNLPVVGGINLLYYKLKEKDGELIALLDVHDEAYYAGFAVHCMRQQKKAETSVILEPFYMKSVRTLKKNICRGYGNGY